jgi:hypothetical protein
MQGALLARHAQAVPLTKQLPPIPTESTVEAVMPVEGHGRSGVVFARSSGGVVVRPRLRFHVRLIEPDVQVSRIQPPHKASRPPGRGLSTLAHRRALRGRAPDRAGT